MRIVNRTAFLALPAGTLYSKLTGFAFGEVCIKCETSGNDWWYVDFTSVQSHDSNEWADRMFAAEAGASFPFDFDTENRDGLYDATQMFAVFERHDVEGLIARLQRTLLAS